MKKYSDVAYGKENEQRLDMYLPDKKGFYTIVYIHGGSLLCGNKNDHADTAEYFVSNGYGFVSIDYRMYPSAKFPDYIEDATLAIAFVKDNIKKYGGNGEIIVSGQSAGAWMSLMMCFNPAFLQHVGVRTEEIAGWIIDSAQITSHFTVIQYEKGLDPRLQRIDESSPLYYLDASTKFTRMLVNAYENDMPCRLEQNRLFLRTMQELCPAADVEFAVLEGTHCSGTAARELALKWLKERF